MQEARPNCCFSRARSRFELKSARLRKSQSRPETEKIAVSAPEPHFGFLFLRKTIVYGFSTCCQARPIFCFRRARGRLELKSARVSRPETEKISVSALDPYFGFLFLRKTIVRGLSRCCQEEVRNTRSSTNYKSASSKKTKISKAVESRLSCALLSKCSSKWIPR